MQQRGGAHDRAGTKLTSNLQSLQALLILNTKVRQRLLLQRLLLSLHNVRQRSIAGLIQPQIRSDNHRQLSPQRLNTTIYLVRHLHRTIRILDIDLAGLRRLRPPQQTRQHLTGLALVAINRLLTQQHQVDVLRLDHTLQHLGDRQGLGTTIGAVADIDVECAVGTHGHSGAEGIGALGSASGEGEDVFDLHGALILGAAFAQADGFFDGEFIERVQGVLDTGGFDAGVGLVDAGFDLS